MKNVFVLGSVNYDLVMDTPYIPKSGETLHGKQFMTNAGGKGGNQAVACSKLGGKTFLLGAVGDDGFGKECLQSMQGYGVDCSYVLTQENCNTGVAIILVCEGDNRIFLDSGANFRCDFNALMQAISAHVCEGDILIAQLEMPLETVKEGLKRAKEKKAITILNPAPAKKLDKDILSYVDILVLNESETELITTLAAQTNEQIEIAAQRLHALGSKEVIVTLGSKGCAYSDAKKVQFFPAKKVKAVDTTAAGDTFIGALAAQLVRGKTVAESIDFCQLASSITVQRKGAQISIPTWEELASLDTSKS